MSASSNFIDWSAAHKNYAARQRAPATQANKNKAAPRVRRNSNQANKNRARPRSSNMDSNNILKGLGPLTNSQLKELSPPTISQIQRLQQELVNRPLTSSALRRRNVEPSRSQGGARSGRSGAALNDGENLDLLNGIDLSAVLKHIEQQNPKPSRARSGRSGQPNPPPTKSTHHQLGQNSDWLNGLDLGGTSQNGGPINYSFLNGLDLPALRSSQRSGRSGAALNGINLSSLNFATLQRNLGLSESALKNLLPPSSGRHLSANRRNLAEKVSKCEEGGCKAVYSAARKQKWWDGMLGRPGKAPKYARRTSIEQELAPNDPRLGLQDASNIATTSFRTDSSHLRALLLPKTANGEDLCVEKGREIKASAGFFLHKFGYKLVAETSPSVRHKKLLGAIDQFKNFKLALNGDPRERDPSTWAAKKVAKHLLHKSALLSSRVSRVPSQIMMADSQWLARKFGWRSPDGTKKIATLRPLSPHSSATANNS